MPIPPLSYVRLETAFRRGDYATLLAEGDEVAVTLTGPGSDALTGPLALMMGVAHAAYEANDTACAYLEFGLARSVVPPPIDAPPPPPPAFNAPRAIGPYGVPALTRDGVVLAPPKVRRGRPTFEDHAELLLVELHLLSGRPAEARQRLPRLLDPGRALTTRFGATRAQLALSAQDGEMESAHHFANTAAGIAGRIRSRFRLALVDADRAMLLARQGRGHEALNITDRVLGHLIRPLVGPYQRWSTTEGVILALTLSRHAARGGDELSAERLLRIGEAAAPPLSRQLLTGHVHLARATRAIELGALDDAESHLLDAMTTFHACGYRPSAASCQAEQARLAHRRDLSSTARPLYLSALAELREIGQLPEAREVQTLLAALDAGRPPPRLTGEAGFPDRPDLPSVPRF